MLGQLHTDEHSLSESSAGGSKASHIEAESVDRSWKTYHLFLQNLGAKSTSFLKNGSVQSVLKPHLKLKHNQKLRKHRLSKCDNVSLLPHLILPLSQLPSCGKKYKVMPGSKGGESE